MVTTLKCIIEYQLLSCDCSHYTLISLIFKATKTCTSFNRKTCFHLYSIKNPCNQSNYANHPVSQSNHVASSVNTIKEIEKLLTFSLSEASFSSSVT